MRNHRDEGKELQAALSLGQEVDREARLIDAARAADPAAWGELYQRYFPRMYTYAYCRIGDSAAAEDIAAQVFLEAWKGIKSFQYRGVPISAWLYRIAHDLTADLLRRRNRIKFEPLGDGSREPQLTGGGHEDSVLIRQEVVSALRRLTSEQQQVVVMRFMEGFSLAAVAASTGKSEEAVKGLQHRALKSLRRGLEKTRNREA
jgi:RNA polymerase sigma-70 factor (ECF subfamily)